MNQNDLFSTEQPTKPLAERLRPQTLDDIIGQQHLIGAGRSLRLAVESGHLHSMILWGPSGVGKTTLARILANSFYANYLAISAVLDGITDIRRAITSAKEALILGKKTIVFVDEVHRFNKAQQDAFLPYVESGLITFIGATTENPAFEVNNALRSRSQIYVLQRLSEQELTLLCERVFRLPEYSAWQIAPQEIKTLTTFADGDARRLINILEQIFIAGNTLSTQHITTDLLSQVLGEKVRQFDKGKDHFYDQISALHKSIRGSHPNASLYWFCRMMDAGVDMRYLARRIVRIAWEDIGLADPRAMQIAENAAAAYDRLGSPEGELALSQAVIYLACSAKSNAGYVAFKQARQFVQDDSSREVPIHLRNAPTTLAKSLGYGRAYRYAHDEPNAYASGESYMPDNLPEPDWYQPVLRGLEIQIAEKLSYLKKLDEDTKK